MKTLKFVIFALALGGLATSCASKSAATAKSATPSTASKAASSSGATGAAATNTKVTAKSRHKKAQAAATSGAKAEGNEVTCTAGGDTRTIQVNKTEQGCEVVYTKNGQTNSVANGNADMKHCDDTSEKIQKNLEGAGYTCK